MDSDGNNPVEIRKKEIQDDVKFLYELYQKSLIAKEQIELSDKAETLV